MIDNRTVSKAMTIKLDCEYPDHPDFEPGIPPGLRTEASVLPRSRRRSPSRTPSAMCRRNFTKSWRRSSWRN